VLPKDQQTDAIAVLGTLHHGFSQALLGLMDGFYSNIEDGLFELAYRTENEDQRRRCFDLMRELRFRRNSLVQSFARVMERYQDRWFQAPVQRAAEDGEMDPLERLVMRMAEKSTAHFGGVLQQVNERASQLSDNPFANIRDLPISPDQVSRAFVVSCRSLKLDTESIEIIQQLFSRFVLDGLGLLYGECNQFLQDKGYLTDIESQRLTTKRA
jgi:hypothetical protein